MDEARWRIEKGRAVPAGAAQAVPEPPPLLELSRPEPHWLAKLGTLTELGGLLVGLNLAVWAPCLVAALGMRLAGGGETPFGPMALTGTAVGLVTGLLVGGFVWTRSRRMRYGTAQIHAHEVRVLRSWGKRTHLPLDEIDERLVTPHGVWLRPRRGSWRRAWRAWWAPVLVPTACDEEVHAVIQLLDRLTSEREGPR